MRTFVFIFLALLATGQQTNAWWDEGHMLVFQIALLRNPSLATYLNQTLQIDAQFFPVTERLISNAVWPDKLPSHEWSEFENWHFIDIPYSPFGQPTQPPTPTNAQWALNNLYSSIRSHNPWVKAIAWRLFIHIMGDIHQPLHTTSLFTNHFPHGDHGGNLFHVEAFNGNATRTYRLHEIWDTAGLTLAKSYTYPLSEAEQQIIHTQAAQMLVQNNQVCEQVKKEFPPGTPFAKKVNAWIQESHDLAKTMVYEQGALKPGTTLTPYYLSNANLVSQRQITRAGCRLAYLFPSNY